MKSLFLLAVGVVGGFAVAHQFNKTPRGRQFFGGLHGSPGGGWVVCQDEEARTGAQDSSRSVRSSASRAL